MSLYWNSSATFVEETVSGRELSLILFLTFIFFTGYNVLIPILPLYITSLGASRLELGLIMAVLPATSILARLPFSVLSSRAGRWPIAISALLLQLLAYLLFYIAPSKVWLYPISSLYGLAVSSFGPCAIAIALDSAPFGRKGIVMGRFYAAIGAAMIVGPLLTSLLTFCLEYSSVFLFVSILPAVGLSIFLFLGGLTLLRRPSLSSLVTGREGGSPISSLRRILFQRNIAILSASSVTFFIALGAFETMFPVYAKDDLQLRSFQVSLLFAARGIPNAVSRIPSGAWSDKVGRRLPLILSYSMTCLALFLISMVNDLFPLMLLIGLYGLAWGARTAPSAALYSDNVSPVDIGMVSTLIWLTSDIAMAAGSSLAGALSLMLPTPMILRVAAALVFLGLLGILMIRETDAEKFCPQTGRP
ncbi:MAG: MFS transporter [Candidatus Bathyarchaeia archaeon]